MEKPTNIETLQEAVRTHRQVLAVGAGTKPRLSAVEGEVVPISTLGLSGITEYDPSEYTFTALAGTPVAEVERTLAEQGQFLPCGTLLPDAGATLGGAIASGLSGPERFRYGGLRDFLLGITYIDGEGRAIRSGGKVVKNAAGFDLPKFFVGSLGRYGILAEVTFKVFPAPPSTTTVRVSCADHAEAAARLATVGRARWEVSAADYNPQDRALLLQIGGPEKAVGELVSEVEGEWPGAVERLDSEACWAILRELTWANGPVAKVALSLGQVAPLLERLGDDVRARVSSGGNVAYLSAPDLTGISEILEEQGLGGITILGGQKDPLWLGARRQNEIAGRVKEALDPEGRFPKL